MEMCVYEQIEQSTMLLSSSTRGEKLGPLPSSLCESAAHCFSDAGATCTGAVFFNNWIRLVNVALASPKIIIVF